MAARLLLDENLSYRILGKIADLFPDSEHVGRARLADGSDVEVRRYAALHGLTLVTFDADFVDLASLLGTPPKVIRLRCGNSSTAEVTRLLRLHSEAINAFVDAPDSDCLEIHSSPTSPA